MSCSYAVCYLWKGLKCFLKSDMKLDLISFSLLNHCKFKFASEVVTQHIDPFYHRWKEAMQLLLSRGHRCNELMFKCMQWIFLILKLCSLFRYSVASNTLFRWSLQLNPYLFISPFTTLVGFLKNQCKLWSQWRFALRIFSKN